MSDNLFVNLAYLLNRPTGTTSYALNLLPYLQELSPIYLATPASGLGDRANIFQVPTHMTAADGTSGHLRRLWWTQFQLPSLIKKLSPSFKTTLTAPSAQSHSQSPLLFTPIPETPLSFLGARTLRSVVMFHDLIPLRFPEEFGAIKHYFRYYVPQVLAQAEKVICNSQATARDIVDFYGLPAHKIVPIPLGYDAAHFRPDHTAPKVLTDLNLTNTRYFLTLGRQAPYKNIGAVIQAIAQVPDCLLIIAGPKDPRYTPKLEKLAEEKEVRSRVKFLSYIPYTQLPALLSHALALVFPSLWEGFGLPALEAMACGTPVIASNLASIPEVTGQAAYLISPQRLSELTCAMNAIATDDSVRQQLSSAGRQRALNFSWQKTGRATADVLRSVA